jgi:hypothetical protein
MAQQRRTSPCVVDPALSGLPIASLITPVCNVRPGKFEPDQYIRVKGKLKLNDADLDHDCRYRYRVGRSIAMKPYRNQHAILKTFRSFVTLNHKSNFTMKAAFITIKNKDEEKFLKAFFRKTGIKARVMMNEELEDAVFGALIDAGMKTRNVSEESVMKILGTK